MDENASYNHPSSNRPDIDANWQKMEQLLDKEMPAAGNGNNNRRWMLVILLVVISSVIIWYQFENKRTEKNSKNAALKNDTIQKSNAENTAAIKNPGKNSSSQDSSLSLDSLVENKKLLHDTANTDIAKANADKDFKLHRNNILPTNDAQLTIQKDVFLLNQYHKKNNTPLYFNDSVNVLQKNISITKDTFKYHLPGINAEKANINVDPNLANTQNNSANNDPAKAGKDVPVQNNTAVDSSEIQKEMASNNYTENNSTKSKINASNAVTSKTKEIKKKNKTFSSQPSLSAGISPSLSLQHSGYANSSGLNYLAAPDFFLSVDIPLSKLFTLQAGLHPFAGMPLRSDKWNQSLQSLDETVVHTDTNHTITTFTTHKISGLTSFNLPVTLHYAIAPKLNVYAGLQVSAFLYGGTTKHVFITDSSASGGHSSSTATSENIFKTSHSNAIKKTSINGVWGIDYSFTRFTLGLKYINGFSDITNNSFLHNDQKNFVSDFKLSIKVNMNKRKK